MGAGGVVVCDVFVNRLVECMHRVMVVPVELFRFQ